MERTVPRTGSEEIELYLRTYYSLLRSTGEVPIRALEEVHQRMGSLLHPHAGEPTPDLNAFLYSLLRLPECAVQVRRVVLGQSAAVFARHGLGEVETWQPVTARARRRRCFWDGEETLACYIASRSDIDDVIPLLTAFQLEWNKLHALLREAPADLLQARPADDTLARLLQMPPDDLRRLQRVWGSAFWDNLRRARERKKRFFVRLLSGSLNEYRRATYAWWARIEKRASALLTRPVYFVSSNPHSLPNLLSGYALRHEKTLSDFAAHAADSLLREEWEAIWQGNMPSSRENFLYYVLKKYQNTPEGRATRDGQLAHEAALGITRIPSEHSFDLEAQAIEIRRLRGQFVDPRLRDLPWEQLAESDAFILNIDYPLGLAAYHVLSQVAERVGEVRGVYIMGKAATLNGAVGDVMIPNVVHDEHSRNTYLFPNAFSAHDVSPYLVYGTVLDNQKAVTVRGTFLQTAGYMGVFYREGYTDIEMEAGPYLSAIYEMVRPKRYPVDEIVHFPLARLPFDLGIIHYASDTPLSKGKNLGAGSLSYYGMDPTYAAAVAILRRLLSREAERIVKRK